MTDDEIIAFYKEMVDHFGKDLPNPEHEPRRFAYYVRLLRYYKERRARS